MVVTEDDLEKWLGACREEDAAHIRTWRTTPWSALEEAPPPWNHPDLDALAEAATIAHELVTATPPPVLVPSVGRYLSDIRGVAHALRSLRYRAALVGAPAVGKSTAEAHGLELRTPSGDLVLPTGGGSTTMCEILIEQGESWGIVVEPEPTEEVVRLVDELCATYLYKGDRPADERPSIASEVRTALLNMAELGPKTETGADGQSVRREPARELAEKEGERFKSSVLMRLRLAERATTELWWEPGASNEPMAWLRDNLRRINRGLHPAVGLPRRLRLVLARPVVTAGPYSISVIDTRGVTDNVVRRSDLAEALAAPRTLMLLCSTFLSAPDLYVRHLLQYADEQEYPGWLARVAVLLLARPAEPGQVRYEDTDELVDGPEDGIRIKEAHTRQQLDELQVGPVPVTTYNALNDPPARFQKVIIDRIEAVRAQDRRRVSELAAAARSLVKNVGKHAVEEARRKAAQSVANLLDALENLPRGAGRPQDLLLKQVNSAHPRSVWAMSRRRGQWSTLPLDLHLSDGAASIAKVRARDSILKLEGVFDMLDQNAELQDAADLVEQFREAAEQARAAFVLQARSAVDAAIWSHLHADLKLWADCQAEWHGRAGFRTRVVKRLDDWFTGNHAFVEDFEDRLRAVWRKRFIKALRGLCLEAESADGCAD